MSENEQSVFLKNRNEIRLSGIVTVDSFDEFKISATTTSNVSVVVEGESLAINEVSLEEGVIEASGKISGIYYEENNIAAKNGFFRGLFGK